MPDALHHTSMMRAAMNPFLRKLAQPRMWERLLRERLSEPFHLTLLSLWVAAVGSFESKVYFDLVIRQHNAFCLLQAAKFAKQRGYTSYTAIEFGVANGAGLLNMASIAREVTKATGVKIELVGFDSGSGMPAALDYRDHPDFYMQGDFPMQDYDRLRGQLPEGSRLIIGNIAETVAPFLETMRPDCPIGYVVVDVDYYSSTLDCLSVFQGDAKLYLPEVAIYLDDITSEQHNPWQGEYLAIREFNNENSMRKFCAYNLLRSKRLLKNAPWISQVFLLHVLDHSCKSALSVRNPIIHGNPYLDLPTIG